MFSSNEVSFLKGLISIQIKSTFLVQDRGKSPWAFFFFILDNCQYINTKIQIWY